MNESLGNVEEIRVWGDSYRKNEDAFGFETVFHISPSIITLALLAAKKLLLYNKTKRLKVGAPGGCNVYYIQQYKKMMEKMKTDRWCLSRCSKPFSMEEQ